MAASSVLTVGPGSGVGSVAGLSAPATPAFTVKPGTDISGVVAPAKPSATNPIPSNNFFVPAAPPPAPKSPVTNAPVTFPSSTSGSAYVTGTGGVRANSATAPSSFSVDTSNVSSNALVGDVNYGTVANTHSDYLDSVKALATAQQYSPEYLSAYSAAKSASAHGYELAGEHAANPGAFGATTWQSAGLLNRYQEGNNAAAGEANIALSAQELRRQGNIAGATALVDAYKPTSVSPGSSLVNPATGATTFGGTGAYSDYQAQQTYFNLAQNFPDAGIPGYNPAMSPQANLQIAQTAAAQSPSFQSKSTIPVTLPGGGYALVNKNQVAGYRSDGTAIIVSPAVASRAQGYQQSIAGLQKDMSDTQAAINTADSNFPLLLQAVKSAGLNTNAPLVNEITQKIANKSSQSAAMAQLNTLVPSLQTEYSRIIARGGTVDDKTRSAAQGIINGTYTFNQLQAVYDTVSAEGKNVVGGYQKEIDSNTNALETLYNSSGSYSPTSGTSSSAGATGGAGPGWGDLLNG